MRHSSVLACLALLATPAIASCQEAARSPAPVAAPTPSAPPASPAAPASDEAVVVLTFPALASHEGQLLVALYDGAKGWKDGPAVRSITLSAGDAEPTTRLEGLAPGTYAVRVFQDLDGDGKLATGAFGMPTEPYGFSNGAKAAMGPPSFEAAAFTVSPGETVQAITLR